MSLPALVHLLAYAVPFTTAVVYGFAGAIGTLLATALFGRMFRKPRKVEPCQQWNWCAVVVSVVFIALLAFVAQTRCS